MCFLSLLLLGVGACDHIIAPGAAGPSAITVFPAMAQVEEGDLFRLEVKDASSSDGATLSGIDVVWENSNPEVVSVSDGMVRGLTPGEARITATATGGAQATATVRVQRTPTDVELLNVSPLEARVDEELEEAVELKIVSPRGLPVRNVEVRFDVVQGGGFVSPEEAISDDEGIVRTHWTLGTLAGEQHLKLRFPQFETTSPALVAEAFPGDPETITVIPDKISLRLGQAYHFETQVSDKFGNKVTEVPVRWFTSNTDVIEIEDDGWVSARRSGVATIEAEPLEEVSAVFSDLGTSPGQGKKIGHGKGEVEVQDEEEGTEANVTITGGDGQSGPVGATLPEELSIRVTDSRGNPVRQFDVEWTVEEGGGSVSDDVTRTDGQGRASVELTLGEEAGANVVQAKAGGLGSVQFAATAVEGEIVKVVVTPSEGTVLEDAELQFTATAMDEHGNQIDDYADAEWSVVDGSVASVNSDGKARGLAEGTTAVRASIEGVMGSADLQVEAAEGDGSDEGETEDDGSTDEGSDEDNGSDGDDGSTDSTHLPADGPIPAFPGAEGWGAIALNQCRDLPVVVHKVTNTNDSGSGSFRDVLENQVRGDRFDIVTFTTGGLISLSSVIERRRGHCLYIAGQTAPGGGISLVDHRLELRESNDVVVRHIRHRGQNPNTAIMHRGGFRVIYDHITGSWSAGRLIVRFTSIEGLPIADATIQNSLLYEPDAEHATILALVGAPKNDPEARRMSAHRNALLGPGRRMPLCSAYEVSIVNNVMYNWQQRGAEADNTAECDYVANYLKPGPTTLSASTRFSLRPFVFSDVCTGGNCTYSYHVADNRSHVTDFEIGSDPWEDPEREVTCRPNSTSGTWCEADDEPIPPEFRRSTPLPSAPFAVQKRDITDAVVDRIVSVVGHSRSLTCDGSWVSARDEVDAERIQWFRDGTGFDERITASEMVVPVPAKGNACADADGDGLPDAWEERFFGCATCADPDAMGRGGYLVVEHYLNGTDPR